MNLSGSATPDNQQQSGNSNNNVLNLLSNPLYQQLLLGNSNSNAQPSNSNSNSINSLQAQLLQTLTSKTNSNNNNSISNATVPSQQETNFQASNQLIKSANKIANTSSSSVSQENQVSPTSSGANSAPTPEIVKSEQPQSATSSPSSPNFKLSKNIKVHISAVDSKITVSPKVPENLANQLSLQGVKDICLYFMNLSETELTTVFKVNFPGETVESSKSSLVSSLLDKIFSEEQKELKTENSEIKKIADFLEGKNLASFAEKFVSEGFTLQTFLEMGENDVADVSEAVGLKGGEKMRLKQLIRQNVTKNESNVEVKQEASDTEEQPAADSN